MTNRVRIRISPVRRSEADVPTVFGDWRSVSIPDTVKIHFKNEKDSRALQELVDHIGASAALRFCQIFGGNYLYIPQDMRDDHPIVRAIGLEAARHLSYVYALNKIEVPTAVRHLRRLHRASIIASVRERQLTVGRAARILGMTARAVREIANATTEAFHAAPLKPVQPTAQLDLFVPEEQEAADG